MNIAAPHTTSIPSLLAEMALLRHEVKNLREDVAHYEEMIRIFKHQKFGPKSEVYSYGHASLFDEAEIEAENEEAEVYGPWPIKPGKNRGKPVRKSLPANLPRKTTVLDIAEADKFCKISGEPLVQMGEEITEQLSIEPAKLIVLETIRPKYVCHCSACKVFVEGPEAQDTSPVVKIAHLEAQAIPKSMASASLLAHIVVSKYSDAIPLYRQEEIFKRLDIHLPRATMASWVIRCGDLIQPLINLAKEELLKSAVILADETRYQILKRPGKQATSQSYVWVFMKTGQDGGPKVIIYEVGPSRSHLVPLEFLEGYEGYLHADGYSAYETLAAKVPGMTLVADWAHVRRKFDEAVKAHGKLPGVPKATVGLELINELFRLERESKCPDAAARLTMRQKHSAPVIQQLLTWAETTITTVPPKSYIGKALRYMLERWSKLLHFLSDPILRLDTNPVENAIRPFAIGRKNWLFSDSLKGAHSSAALYSLISMARAQGLNPLQYLSDVFTRLPKAITAEDVEALLPWNWQAPVKPSVQ